MRCGIFYALCLILNLEGSEVVANSLTPLEQQAVRRLDDTTDWLVKYGHFILENRDARFLKDKLFEEGLSQMWVTPLIDQNGRLAIFRIKDGGYNYDLEALHRAEVGGHLLEYWVAKVSPQDGVTPVQKCIFMIAEVNPDAKRSLLQTSNSFIPSFSLPGGAEFAFPQEDLSALYGLGAWDYPDCYPASDLPETEIYIDESGAFKKAPAGSLEAEPG